jgi:transcriptional regulator with XRE-family HTH domain
MIEAAQLRAARALLNWSPETMAEKSGTSAGMIDLFETGTMSTPLSTIQKWMSACNDAGVIFISQKVFSGAGVQFKTARR